MVAISVPGPCASLLLAGWFTNAPVGMIAQPVTQSSGATQNRFQHWLPLLMALVSSRNNCPTIFVRTHCPISSHFFPILLPRLKLSRGLV